ncbi:hypothetical protein ACFPOD_03465 [Nitratireductor kimnyeongensis]|uniref:Uncharacterized protein n=1 Tax=Nitratireductor kimnyeongensis TaxID=430679 RepID=A0ABW0T4R2_9HYPH|nr:hypothetical protein [Nitratireductor kimnyeongensis]QZZ34840.1 hypothetical protein KW403_13720 [Nitratireductor kimnyeongensis]
MGVDGGKAQRRTRLKKEEKQNGQPDDEAENDDEPAYGNLGTDCLEWPRKETMVQLVLFACISHWLLVVRHKAPKLEAGPGKADKFASLHQASDRIETHHAYGHTLTKLVVKDDESSVLQGKS